MGVLTAQTVANNVASDLLNRLAPESPAMLDYINRVQLKLLRISRWKFILSAPQRFVTQLGVTDYWIGPSGTATVGTLDTGLNITNLGIIKTESFYDRSNFRLLKKVDRQPIAQTFFQRDLSSKTVPPRFWRNDPNTPNVINIYPAPDNQNNYQPVPDSPALTTAAGGTNAATFYVVQTTLTDSLGGESLASAPSFIFAPLNTQPVVAAPEVFVSQAASGVLYNGYNVYLSATTNPSLPVNVGNLPQTKKANGAAVAIGSSFTYTGTGTPVGASLPTLTTIEPLRGYLIEFNYFAITPQVTSLATNLLIPDAYKDVFVSGVNYFTAQFLKDRDAIEYWKAEWDAGLVSMIRDKNLFPRAPDFISPDSAAIARITPAGIEVYDESSLPVA